MTETFATPKSAAPLGGDVLGRDVLSRVLAGGWELLLMAAAATLLGGRRGGRARGSRPRTTGGWTDGVIMRIVDVFLAFPQLVFALLLVSVLGPKIWLIILAVGISHAPQVARVIRSVALDVCERDYVKAVELMDTPGRKVMAGEVLPNMMSVGDGRARAAVHLLDPDHRRHELSGVRAAAARDANWGLMINENRIGLVVNPWAVIVPAGLIAVLTIGLNTFTDAIARASLGVDRPAEEATLMAPVSWGSSR